MPTTTTVPSNDSNTPSIVDQCSDAISALSIVETVAESTIMTSDTPDTISSPVLYDTVDSKEESADEEYDGNDEFGEFGYAPLADSEEDEQETETPSNFDHTTHLKEFTIPKPVEPIPEDDAKFIKEVMSRFEFPEHAIPAWAKYIPEQAWLPKVKEVPASNESSPS